MEDEDPAVAIHAAAQKPRDPEVPGDTPKPLGHSRRILPHPQLIYDTYLVRPCSYLIIVPHTDKPTESKTDDVTGSDPSQDKDLVPPANAVSKQPGGPKVSLQPGFFHHRLAPVSDRVLSLLSCNPHGPVLHIRIYGSNCRH